MVGSLSAALLRLSRSGLERQLFREARLSTRQPPRGLCATRRSRLPFSVLPVPPRFWSTTASHTPVLSALRGRVLLLEDRTAEALPLLERAG